MTADDERHLRRAIALAAVGVVITLGLGVVAYDLDVDPAKLPAAIVTFGVGVASFAAMGMAIAGVCPSASAASATRRPSSSRAPASAR